MHTHILSQTPIFHTTIFDRMKRSFSNVIACFYYMFTAATWRHINTLPFVCYAVYMDCMQIDSLVAAMVLKLFNQLGLKCDTNYTGKSINKSNLYM